MRDYTIDAPVMLITAAVGVMVNIVMGFLLHFGGKYVRQVIRIGQILLQVAVMVIVMVQRVITIIDTMTRHRICLKHRRLIIIAGNEISTFAPHLFM
jgi:hypothetical protein